MDLTGSLIDTNLRIYPSKVLLDFLASIKSEDCPPTNILNLLNGKISDKEQTKEQRTKTKLVQLNDEDIKNLKRIKEVVKLDSNDNSDETDVVDNEIDEKDKKVEATKEEKEPSKEVSKENKAILNRDEDSSSKDNNHSKQLLEHKKKDEQEIDENFLTTDDLDWLYRYVHEKRGKGEKDIPFLHELLNEAKIEMPNNKVIKRNPVLEARCVKLRAQQEAREYRKMTKSVDNVRMRFPEDSISYQLKQVNRQLIAIGQFIISIFAGFLFGFRGVEWMVGNLDFGFRLLLGVMCALVIALAEIYFLAKKLNEELNIPETIQLGGPPKFANDPYQTYTLPRKAIDKEHQD